MKTVFSKKEKAKPNVPLVLTDEEATGILTARRRSRAGSLSFMTMIAGAIIWVVVALALEGRDNNEYVALLAGSPFCIAGYAYFIITVRKVGKAAKAELLELKAGLGVDKLKGHEEEE